MVTGTTGMADIEETIAISGLKIRNMPPHIHSSKQFHRMRCARGETESWQRTGSGGHGYPIIVFAQGVWQFVLHTHGISP